MLKAALKRGILGFLIGVFIAIIVPLFISIIINDGNFYPIPPSFIKDCGNELNAAILQYTLSGLCGFGCAASSVFFSSDRLNILQSTALNFLGVSISTLPIAYVCHWINHSLVGVISYFAIFIVIYIIIWLISYLSIRNIIIKANKKIFRISKN